MVKEPMQFQFPNNCPHIRRGCCPDCMLRERGWYIEKADAEILRLEARIRGLRVVHESEVKATNILLEERDAAHTRIGTLELEVRDWKEETTKLRREIDGPCQGCSDCRPLADPKGETK